MSWANILFYAILVTSLTGIIFQLTGLCISKLFVDIDEIVKVYWIKITIAAYIVPVMFCIVYIIDRLMGWSGKSVKGSLFFKTPQTGIALMIGVILWMMTTAVLVWHNIWRYYIWRKIRLYNTKIIEQPVIDIFEQCKELLGIQEKKIKLRMNNKINSPVIVGIFHPYILLPQDNYIQADLHKVFIHELMHYKNKDVLWKTIALFASIFNSFNPLIYCLNKKLSLMLEIQCDVCTCESGKELFTTQEYFCVVYEGILRGVGEGSYLMATFFETDNQILRRIRTMSERKNRTKMKHSIAIALTLIFIMGSSLSSTAAGIGVTEGYSNWQNYSERTYETVHGDFQLDESTYEIHTEGPGEGEDVTVKIEEEKGFSLFSTAASLDWSVEDRFRQCTNYFYCEKGTKISVLVACDPKTAPMKIGIIRGADGVRYYANSDSQGIVNTTFNIDKTGFYCVYAENLNDFYVNVKGTYTKP